MPPVDCRRSELGNRSVQQRATEPFLCDSVVTATPGAGSRLAVTVLVMVPSCSTFEGLLLAGGVRGRPCRPDPSTRYPLGSASTGPSLRFRS
jgi:hypothetical protein